MNESTDELKESNNQIIKEHSKDESDEGFLQFNMNDSREPQ